VTASDALVHRIEALPGAGRYAVTFRGRDGLEQTAVVQLGEPDAQGHRTVTVAEASLPTGWTRTSEPFLAAVDALHAVERSRALSAPAGAVLRDVDGGWDVSLGNVVLGADGRPQCTVHPDVEMAADGEIWTCTYPDCGAQGLYAGVAVGVNH
jgi:hypothetical protein